MSLRCSEGVSGRLQIYVGGRWGKKVAQGRALPKLFTEEAEVMELIEKAIDLFKTEGIAGERFSDTIQRIGFETVCEKLLNK